MKSRAKLPFKNQKETEMMKFRTALMFIAGIIIFAFLMIVDYSDLSWANNSGSYLGILAMVLLIVSMLLVRRSEMKE